MRGRGDRLRRLVRSLHLWLGLNLGGLFALLGLTGSVLAFYPEIDALLHPEIRAEGRAAPDWDRALAAVRREFPNHEGAWRFELTGKPDAIPARYYDPPERAGHDFRPLMVWLSPGGSAVLRRDYWGEYAMTFVYDLHFRLLLGKTAGTVLGWTGFALIALLLSGLWAWWPRGSWRKAFRVKPRARPQRALRDWHKTAGLSGVLVLLILTGTGIMLELPEESDAALLAAGLPVDSMPHVHPADLPPAISAAQALSAAATALPGARVAWMYTPPASGGHWQFRLQVPGDPSRRFPHSFVWVDAASGKVIAVHDARRAGAGSTINNWLHPLHDGSALGLAGRILVALAGLAPALLFVTGVMRWRLRKRPSPAAPRRASASARGSSSAPT